MKPTRPAPSAAHPVLGAALASVLTLGLATPAAAADMKAGKEKCFGVAKAGQNDCQNLAGTHDCAGKAKTDNDPGDWKFVPKGTCQQLGGLDAAAAKAKLGK